MMTFPSWTEIVAILVAMGGGTWRWIERRDERSDLSLAMKEAEKAARSLKEAIDEKNQELASKDQRIERLEDQNIEKDRRIDRLEDRLYTGGGQP